MVVARHDPFRLGVACAGQDSIIVWIFVDYSLDLWFRQELDETEQRLHQFANRCAERGHAGRELRTTEGIAHLLHNSRADDQYNFTCLRNL